MFDEWTGKWYPEEDYSNYPKEKLCDCDRICMAIRKDGYVPKTSMENLVNMVIAYFDCPDNFGEYDEETGFGGWGDFFTVEKCLEYVDLHGGWKEYDHEI